MGIGASVGGVGAFLRRRPLASKVGAVEKQNETETTATTVIPFEPSADDDDDDEIENEDDDREKQKGKTINELTTTTTTNSAESFHHKMEATLDHRSENCVGGYCVVGGDSGVGKDSVLVGGSVGGGDYSVGSFGGSDGLFYSAPFQQSSRAGALLVERLEAEIESLRRRITDSEAKEKRKRRIHRAAVLELVQKHEEEMKKMRSEMRTKEETEGSNSLMESDSKNQLVLRLSQQIYEQQKLIENLTTKLRRKNDLLKLLGYDDNDEEEDDDDATFSNRLQQPPPSRSKSPLSPESTRSRTPSPPTHRNLPTPPLPPTRPPPSLPSSLTIPPPPYLPTLPKSLPVLATPPQTTPLLRRNRPSKDHSWRRRIFNGGVALTARKETRKDEEDFDLPTTPTSLIAPAPPLQPTPLIQPAPPTLPPLPQDRAAKQRVKESGKEGFPNLSREYGRQYSKKKAANRNKRL